MKRLILTSIVSVLLSPLWADTGFGPPALSVSEVDNSPKQSATHELVFPNGSLTKSGTKITVDVLSGSSATATYVSYSTLSATTSGSSGCELVGIDAIGTPTNTNLCQWMTSFGSAGRLTGGTISDAGSQTINVSSGTGYIKAVDLDTSTLISFDWVGVSGASVTNNTSLYIGVEYNSGSPRITTKAADTWDLDTSFPLGSVINQSGDLYINNNPWWVGDGITNIIERFQAEGYVKRDEYVGGLILGETGTRNPTLSAGTAWSRLNEFGITAKDCSGTDRFYAFYRDGSGSWTRTVELSSYPVTQYDDNSGTLQDLLPNKYANWWVFVEINADNTGKLMLIYPQNSYSSAASAEEEDVPPFPTSWYEHGILVGRILFKTGATSATEIQSTFSTVFNAALAADHTNLSNIGTLTHAQIDTQLAGDATTYVNVTGDAMTGLLEGTTIQARFVVSYDSGTVTRDGDNLISSVLFTSGRNIAFTRTSDLITSATDGTYTWTVTRDVNGNITSWEISK